jgi:hypothetical protein
MIGGTLADLRSRIDALASDEGAYYLVCGRTGDRPVPAAGMRFEDRETARTAARRVEQYRSALRRYDPQYPYHDVIVCQDGGACPSSGDATAVPGPRDWRLTDPVLDGGGVQPSNRDLVEFCHRVTAAVFEALSGAGYDVVEREIMNDYVDLAETVADPDDLCLCLLESVATELDTRLAPSEQVDVLADAATRLTPIESDERPLSAALGSLERCGLVGEYRQSPWSADLDAETRSVVVRLSEYALSPRHGRLPLLPLVIGLFRRPSSFSPSSHCPVDGFEVSDFGPVARGATLHAVDDEFGWRVTFALSNDRAPNGLASAPIHSEA